MEGPLRYLPTIGSIHVALLLTASTAGATTYNTIPQSGLTFGFVADETFAHAAHIDRLLHEAQRVGLAREDDSDGAA